MIEPEIKKQLENCNNLQEMLKVLQKNYDLSNEMGNIVKSTIISKLPLLLQMARAKRK